MVIKENVEEKYSGTVLNIDYIEQEFKAKLINTTDEKDVQVVTLYFSELSEYDLNILDVGLSFTLTIGWIDFSKSLRIRFSKVLFRSCKKWTPQEARSLKKHCKGGKVYSIKGRKLWKS